MDDSIASSLISSLRLFNSLVGQHRIKTITEVPLPAWNDELGRLRVWAANIGAHQSGQSSLDYRLRDASHIKVQINNLLGDLQALLRDAEELVSVESSPTIPDRQSSDNSGCQDSLNTSDSIGRMGDEEGDESELQQIHREIKDAINCLYKMSMLIRNPARHDRVVGSRKGETAVFEPYDRNHVSHKFPHADNSVIGRLGLAITRRRQDLKYREKHRLKMGQGISQHTHDAMSEGATNIESYREKEMTMISSTIATDFEGPHIEFEDATSTSGISRTSYAASIEGGGTISVPPPPRESAHEQPFECPYCYFVITIKNRRAWTRHVFKDIMPYSCVFPGCRNAAKLYSSRREWFHHEMTLHMKSYCGDAYYVMCPLCQEVDVPRQRIERHLARHLEELALFALPQNSEEDEVGPNDSRVGIDDAPSDSESDKEVDENTYMAEQEDCSEGDHSSDAQQSQETNSVTALLTQIDSEPKKVTFQLLPDQDSELRPEAPLTSLIHAHDTAESIFASLKNFYGFDNNSELDLQDSYGNKILPNGLNIVHNMTIYVRIIAQKPPKPPAGLKPGAVIAYEGYIFDRLDGWEIASRRPIQYSQDDLAKKMGKKGPTDIIDQMRKMNAARRAQINQLIEEKARDEKEPWYEWSPVAVENGRSRVTKKGGKDVREVLSMDVFIVRKAKKDIPVEKEEKKDESRPYQV